MLYVLYSRRSETIENVLSPSDIVCLFLFETASIHGLGIDCHTFVMHSISRCMKDSHINENVQKKKWHSEMKTFDMTWRNKGEKPDLIRLTVLTLEGLIHLQPSSVQFVLCKLELVFSGYIYCKNMYAGFIEALNMIISVWLVHSGPCPKSSTIVSSSPATPVRITGKENGWIDGWIHFDHHTMHSALWWLSITGQSEALNRNNYVMYYIYIYI